MSDIGGPAPEVDPTNELKIMHLESRIYEKESRIARIKLDIQDLENLSIKTKKFELKQVELEHKKLVEEKRKIMGGQ